MTKEERFRLKILKGLCKNFQVGKSLPDNAIPNLFPNENPDDIIKALRYFREKNYLSAGDFYGREILTNVTLHSSAVDFVEENTFTKRLIKWLLRVLKSVPILALFIKCVTD
jgi:hypothetical protein